MRIERTVRSIGSGCLFATLVLVAFASRSDANPQAVPFPSVEAITNVARAERSATTSTTASTTSTSGPLVYLHGLCGTGGCPAFLAGLGDRDALVCPAARAQGPCGGAGRAWDEHADRVIHDAVEQRAAQAPASIDPAQPGVLVGFSQGAYIANSLIRNRRGNYRAVVFIGANIRISRHRLEAAGIHRALFAAGRYDMTFRTLRETAASLHAEGFEARFVDLGRVGHTYVPAADVPGWRDALAWVNAPSASP